MLLGKHGVIRLGLCLSIYAAYVNSWSPTNGYAPGNITCGDDDNDNDIIFLRAADSLSTDEEDWLQLRALYTEPALKQFLERSFKEFSNDTSLIDDLMINSSSVPKISIACSGGGYRAMLSGAGMLSAMDNRTDGANEHGLGGLLQSATYLSGLSGGNWLVGTLAYNNWTSVQEILDNMTNSDSIWDISNSILNPGGWNIFETISIWDEISDSVESKSDAGFNVSITDIWGRALSYDFFPSLDEGGVGLTWDTLRDADVFKNGEMPFPMSIAVGRYPGTTIINLNATVFEFNPFEMGSWDFSLYSFFNVKYVGTNVTNGTPIIDGECINGFDNTGFILGTSSSLFNQFLLQINNTNIPEFIRNILTNFLTDASEENSDISVWSPNPFYESENIPDNYSQSIVLDDALYLVDGGEDGQNIPLVPLLQQRRDVDVIFALDNSADTEYGWPDGYSLIQTYNRQFGPLGRGIAFPYVPDVNTFINLGLNKRPTFFGCNAQNLSSLEYTPPLIVYMPNNEKSFESNTSTFQMSYDLSERLGMIQNGFEAVTMNNFTEDSKFLGCISCAILRRKQQSLNYTWPTECESCFEQYCWNGTIDSSTPSGDYDISTNYSSTESLSESYSSLQSLSSSISSSSSLSMSSSNFFSSSTSSESKESNAANLNNVALSFSCFLGVLLGFIDDILL